MNLRVARKIDRRRRTEPFQLLPYGRRQKDEALRVRARHEGLHVYLDVWDQTIGCDLCLQAWWDENNTDPLEDFHAAWCPLRGRRDLHKTWGVNYNAFNITNCSVRFETPKETTP